MRSIPTRRVAIPVALTLFIIAGIAGTAGAQHPDHPLISRYAGSTEFEKDYLVADFDEYPLVVGPLVNKKFTKVQRLEGRITHLHFRDPADRSTLEIATNYRTALQKAGFQILFACSGRECGNGNSYEHEKWIGEWCADETGASNCAKESMRYVAARLPRPSGDAYVVVKVEHPLFDGARSGTYLNVVEVRPMEGGNVTVNAAALASDISTAGHAPVYGIYFDTGKAEVKPESEATLTEIATLLAANTALRLFVVGHTDNVGTFAANMTLSKQRADAVVAVLVSRFHVAVARLQASGVGPLSPVESNRSEEGKAKNRRVELVEQ